MLAVSGCVAVCCHVRNQFHELDFTRYIHQQSVLPLGSISSMIVETTVAVSLQSLVHANGSSCKLFLRVELQQYESAKIAAREGREI